MANNFRETAENIGNLHFSPEKVRVALFLNGAFANAGFPETNIFVGDSGAIQISAYDNNYYGEAVIETNGTFSLSFEKDNDDIIVEEGLDLANTLTQINYWGRQWVLSESSVHKTTTLTADALLASLSVNQIMGGFQPWTQTAFDPLAKHLVRTFGDFIDESLMSRQSSGGLIEEFSPIRASS